MAGTLRSDRDLLPGVELRTDLGTWQVVETPGHSASHICLHQPERRVLISGDHLLGRVSLYFDIGLSPDPVGEFLHSLDVVDALDPRLALAGHARPFTDVRAHIDANRELVAERLDAVRAAALAAGPLSVYDVTREIAGEAYTREMATWMLRAHPRLADPPRGARARLPGSTGPPRALGADGLAWPDAGSTSGWRPAGSRPSPSSSSRPRPPMVRPTFQDALAALARLEPTFVSVTYGAGGSEEQRCRTIDIVSRDQGRPRPGGGRPLHLRRRHECPSCAGCSTACATPASRTCWRCAVTRRPAWRRASGRRSRAGCATRAS